MNLRGMAAAGLALWLAACATKLVSDDFAGPTATVRDSYKNVTSATLIKAGSADFFVLQRADGKPVDNAISITRMTNTGNGFMLRPEGHERRVPIAAMQAELHAETYYSAPVTALFSNTHEVTGMVSFTPVAGETYVVIGELREGYAAVWIETAGGEVVTAKVERRK